MAGELLLPPASETPALYEPQEAGRREGRGGLRDGIHAAVLCVCAEIESQFVPISMRLRGVDECLCVGV